MSNNLTVNIGIITFERLEYTKQCIQALFDTIVDAKYKITVVDNNSTDGTQEYLKELLNKNIIHNLCLMSKNVGVAKAANTAWTKEPKADFFLKLDNDMIAQKAGWLEAMIDVMQTAPMNGLSTLGYSVEPISYPVVYKHRGYDIRAKRANIGGACLFIPHYTRDVIGYFCEDYGLYSEEDCDYNCRLAAYGRHNAYMADENAFIHLPAGKAAAIDTSTFEAKDGAEEIHEKEYRDFKDECRRKAIAKLYDNINYYQQGKKIFRNTNSKKDFKFKWVKNNG